MKVLIVFYSMYGHIYRMGEAVAEGVRKVNGAIAEMRRVPETSPEEVLKIEFSYYAFTSWHGNCGITIYI
jgi:multimeric flavodoxin WrbA